MLRTMGTVVAVCGVYFVVGAAVTAGCILGAAAAEKLLEKYE